MCSSDLLTTSAFQNQCLSRTNAIRGLHKNTPNMTTDPNLVSYAKSRCATISQGYILSVGHSGLANGYGENIYWGYSHRKIIPNCNSAVNGWNSESPNYNYAHPGFSSTTSHFTQLVWTSTTREGCAVCGCPHKLNISSTTSYAFTSPLEMFLDNLPITCIHSHDPISQ